jgi:hypothetical protein
MSASSPLRTFRERCGIFRAVRSNRLRCCAADAKQLPPARLFAAWRAICLIAFELEAHMKAAEAFIKTAIVVALSVSFVVTLAIWRRSPVPVAAPTDGRAAIATPSAVATTGTGRDVPYNGRTAWTDVLVNRAGHWQIVVEHGSQLPSWLD